MKDFTRVFLNGLEQFEDKDFYWKSKQLHFSFDLNPKERTCLQEEWIVIQEFRNCILTCTWSLYLTKNLAKDQPLPFLADWYQSASQPTITTAE